MNTKWGKRFFYFCKISLQWKQREVRDAGGPRLKEHQSSFMDRRNGAQKRNEKMKKKSANQHSFKEDLKRFYNLLEVRAIFLNATWHQNEQMTREELYWICLQKWHISREMPQKVSCCARIQWSWVFLRNKSFHRSWNLNLPVQLPGVGLAFFSLKSISNSIPK